MHSKVHVYMHPVCIRNVLCLISYFSILTDSGVTAPPQTGNSEFELSCKWFIDLTLQGDTEYLGLKNRLKFKLLISLLLYIKVTAKQN